MHTRRSLKAHAFPLHTFFSLILQIYLGYFTCALEQTCLDVIKVVLRLPAGRKSRLFYPEIQLNADETETVVAYFSQLSPEVYSNLKSVAARVSEEMSSCAPNACHLNFNLISPDIK